MLRGRPPTRQRAKKATPICDHFCAINTNSYRTLLQNIFNSNCKYFIPEKRVQL